MRAAAKIISFLFHPLIQPCYAFALVYITSPLLFSAYDHQQLVQIFLTVFINTFLFPVISILLVRALGFVKSFQMDDPKERLIPYLATGAFYIWGYVVFRKSGMPQIFDIILLGATITLFAIFMLNLFWKVSAHMGAMGSFLVLAIALSMISTTDVNYLVILLVLLAGMIASSRLQLNAHTTAEIFVGFLIGVMSQMVAMQFY